MDKIIKTELGTIQEVVLEKMQLLYTEFSNDLESQKKTWPEFEARFPSLIGRKMYGLDYGEINLYRVCSLVRESDNGETFGLNQFELEEGTYMRLRLKFEPPELYEKIGPAFKLMIGQYEESINWNLPFIEHYKAKNILDIMVPIAK